MTYGNGVTIQYVYNELDQKRSDIMELQGSYTTIIFEYNSIILCQKVISPCIVFRVFDVIVKLGMYFSFVLLVSIITQLFKNRNHGVNSAIQ